LDSSFGPRLTLIHHNNIQYFARMPLVEKELLTLPEHLSPFPVLVGSFLCCDVNVKAMFASSLLPLFSRRFIFYLLFVCIYVYWCTTLYMQCFVCFGCLPLVSCVSNISSASWLFFLDCSFGFLLRLFATTYSSVYKQVYNLWPYYFIFSTKQDCFSNQIRGSIEALEILDTQDTRGRQPKHTKHCIYRNVRNV
jgi:hypothetical protein